MYIYFSIIGQTGNSRHCGKQGVLFQRENESTRRYQSFYYENLNQNPYSTVFLTLTYPLYNRYKRVGKV